jgi:hypothetical protein
LTAPAPCARAGVCEQWLATEHPDPAFVQFMVLQSALRLLLAGKTDVHSHPLLVVTGDAIAMRGPEFQALLSQPNVYLWSAPRARARSLVAGRPAAVAHAAAD